MTDQQPQTPQFNIAELGAKFGAQQAQDYAQIITLEKQLTAQSLTIQAMTKKEAALVDDIQELEAKISEFTQQEYDFVEHIEDIEGELVELKKSLIMINEPHLEQIAMSPEAAEIAKEGTAIIQEQKNRSD